MAWRAAGGVLTVAGDVASAFGCPVPGQTIQNIVEACEATGVNQVRGGILRRVVEC